jgi:hypothetical protein
MHLVHPLAEMIDNGVEFARSKSRVAPFHALYTRELAWRQRGARRSGNAGTTPKTDLAEPVSDRQQCAKAPNSWSRHSVINNHASKCWVPAKVLTRVMSGFRRSVSRQTSSAIGRTHGPTTATSICDRWQPGSGSWPR